MRQVHSFPLILSVMVSVFYLSGQAQSPSQSLQRSLPSMMDSTGIPGLSIAVIEDGQLRWSQGFGVTDQRRKQPVDTATIFQGASLGKPLFAYAVLKLCETGAFSLDKPLMKYVPQSYLEAHFFKGPVADEQIRSITARMVLNHTSGLPNWRQEGKSLTTLFLPGSRYSYSGEGYYLLQQVVEYIMQEPIETYMQRAVFRPLGMNHTSYSYQGNQDCNCAYDQTGASANNGVEVVNVAHTLRTTAPDYARFLVATVLKPGNQDLASKALLSSLVNTDICQPGQVSWGLGMAIQHLPTGNLFCQWAKSPTASGYMIGSVDQKKAVIYLVNVANQGLRIAERIVQLTLNVHDSLFACFGVQPYNARP